ncbi:MAG: hypothetical protein FWE84_03345 [Firmicutes bacterium]|nr:hypothetical protein [Bacillota bacterium]
MLNEQDSCRFCRKKGLRNPEKNDYCFLVEVDLMFGEMFKGVLEEENIPYSDIPVGNGVRSYFGLRLENLKIFVVYEFFEKAKEILTGILMSFEENQNRNIKKNIDKLFVLPRSEKKIKKVLNLAENDNLIAYCADKIMNADRIVNKGGISSCIKGGEYICVYKENELIMFNSVTYEIIAAEKTKK